MIAATNRTLFFDSAVKLCDYIRQNSSPGALNRISRQSLCVAPGGVCLIPLKTAVGMRRSRIVGPGGVGSRESTRRSRSSRRRRGVSTIQSSTGHDRHGAAAMRQVGTEGCMGRYCVRPQPPITKGSFPWQYRTVRDEVRSPQKTPLVRLAGPPGSVVLELRRPATMIAPQGA